MPEQEQASTTEQLLQAYVRERDAMVERSARSTPLHPERLLAAVRATRKSDWIPNTEIFISTENCLVVNVEIAGIRRENLEIIIDGDRLLIKGQRPESDPSGAKASLLLADIHYGPFECVIEIPPGYELSRSNAKYQNGLLRIEVPKAQLSGFEIENVLRDYVRDRDRVADKVALSPEVASSAGHDLTPLVIANALKETPPRRSWWEATRRRVLAIFGKAPKESQESGVRPLPVTMTDVMLAYQPALHAFLLHQGYNTPAADDVLNKFVGYVLQNDLLARFQSERGGLRRLLLASMRDFLGSQLERKQELAATQWIPIEDFVVAEQPAQITSAESVYERRWALTMLNRVSVRLAQEYAAESKAELFENLKPFLAKEMEADYSAIARKLGISDRSLRVAVYALRSRFGRLIRDEIAQTVSSADAIEEELRHFAAVLGR